MKRVLSLLLLTIISMPLWAAWLNKVPVTINQADGTKISAFATGDEFYNWISDEQGYTLLLNEEGYLAYAILQGDELIASSFRVGQVEPSSVGLHPGINISSSKMEKIRLSFLEQTQEMEQKAGMTKSVADAEGNLNNLVVYIRFADQNDFTIDTSVYLNMFNETEEDYNSMFNYFQMVSYGSLFLTSTAYPIPEDNIVISYVDEHNRNYYEPYHAVNNPEGYSGNQRNDREFLLLKNAIEYIADEVPEDLDLDYNNDNRVDNVCFIVKGGPGAWADLLWPHRWSLYGEDAYINGKQVWDFNFQLESSLNSSGVGVLCHEMYHSLGAPDLYHYSQDNFTPVGPWDVMEQNANPPQSMGAYMKHIYGGWIDEIPEITESGYYTLNSLQDAENHVFKIASPNHNWQYFVLEYRKKEGTFESQIPGSGLLVYRIDGSMEGQGNASGPPDEVYLYRKGGTPSVNGSPGHAHLSLETDRTALTNETDPRLFLSNNNFGGIEITEVSSAGESISFFVNMPGEPLANFEADATIICPNQVVTFSDKSAGLPEDYQWNFSPDDVTFVDGTDANSTSPKVIFNTDQNYSVSLSIDNEYGTSDVTKSDYIQFTSAELPFMAQFEEGNLNSKSFYVLNPDGQIGWKTMPVAGNGSALAAGMRIRKNYTVGDRDGLVTPPLDFTSFSNMDLQFEYAYAKYMQNFSDSLIVYVSVDCGDSWERIFAGGDDGTGSFSTAPRLEEEFIPALSDDWCSHGYGAECLTLNLNAYLGFDRVRVMFETYSQLGNNLYLDNIVIAPNVGLDEDLIEDGLVISPNPANHQIKLENISNAQSLQVFDIYGRLVWELKHSIKDNSVDLHISKWNSGVYIIKLDGKTACKFVKE